MEAYAVDANDIVGVPFASVERYIELASSLMVISYRETLLRFASNFATMSEGVNEIVIEYASSDPDPLIPFTS